jgi:hypothetical protein
VKRLGLGAALLLVACAGGTASSMRIERHVRPLGTTGPDAVALPVYDRYRYGVVVGSVLTETGERGCNGDVWLEPEGAPVRDVRAIADQRLHNMFRFPQLLPGRYQLGMRCLGFTPGQEAGGCEDRGGGEGGGHDGEGTGGVKSER